MKISRDDPSKILSAKINMGRQLIQSVYNVGRQFAGCVDNVGEESISRVATLCGSSSKLRWKKIDLEKI
jgi:hypothetical protein